MNRVGTTITPGSPDSRFLRFIGRDKPVRFRIGQDITVEVRKSRPGKSVVITISVPDGMKIVEE